jgi:hypothetical protein
MWLFTKYGFVDLVQHPHPDHAHELIVRAQTEEDIASFVRLLDVTSDTPHTISPTVDGDYRFLTIAAKDVVATVIAQLVVEIDYPRFQNSLHFHLGQNNSYVVWLNSNDLKFGELLRQQ